MPVWECGICDKSFETHQDLESHEHAAHSHQNPYQRKRPHESWDPGHRHPTFPQSAQRKPIAPDASPEAEDLRTGRPGSLRESRHWETPKDARHERDR